METNISKLVEAIVSKTKLIHGFMVYDESNTMEESSIDFDRIKQFCPDRTSYETGVNEIQLWKKRTESSLFFLSPNDITSFLSEFGQKLEQKFNRKVAVYLCDNDEWFSLRFHSVWPDEKPWLPDDLSGYQEKIYRL